MKSWLDDGLWLGAKGRALRPEDVMILVDARGELAQLLVARLYAGGAGRRRRPPAPRRAAGGAGPARRGPLRASARRRP
ncbi:hypothetical protein AB5I41_02835 [Sphingomonas sp. MMS24-JH45]